MVGHEGDGAAELVFKSINDCPIDTRKGLYDAIILSGANTMFPGFSSRIKSDVTKLYKENVLKDVNREVKINIKIIDTPRRKYSVFMGACFLSNFYTNNQESYWITKQEWEDAGPKIIYQKCQNIIY